jgi:hypothetical protein
MIQAPAAAAKPSAMPYQYAAGDNFAMMYQLLQAPAKGAAMAAIINAKRA